MVNVYAWPPVAVVARYWTMEQPVSRSRSLITGASYVSAAQRKRILAGFDVAGWPLYSAGYLEALWRFLDGGVHLVRLSSCRIPHGSTVPDDARGGRRITWAVPPQEIPWFVPASPIEWLDGVSLQGTLITSGSFPAVRISGLPTNALVALPGEFLAIHLPAGDEAHMIATETRSDESGVAIVRLVTAPSSGGRVSLGGRETGVFEIASAWPKVLNRLRFPENYGLEFRQVFEDERGPFVEVDPWN
ncbi:hypothetical protein [Paracoccus sp. DMF]|uniref:hypothetical protein n=1 Tax=Paracoccus sp. DMF TaxID=400837 RepID=UPI0011035011|nr:hypothetical protein [Paracoccus sp. DMF]MCV2448454.1 hypothetical protein [Paracoccus sp. DMF]